MAQKHVPLVRCPFCHRWISAKWAVERMTREAYAYLTGWWRQAHRKTRGCGPGRPFQPRTQSCPRCGDPFGPDHRCWIEKLNPPS